MLRNTPWIALCIVCGLCLGCGSSVSSSGEGAVVHAEESSPTPVSPPTTPSDPVPSESDAEPAASELSPVEELKSQLQELAAAKIERTVPPTAVAPSPPPSEEPASDMAEVLELREEVADLRKDVDRLQETVDAALAYIVGELSRENQKLRTDLAEPHQPKSEALHNDTEASSPAQPAPVVPTQVTQHVDYGEAGYLSIKEWGRTPEQAAEIVSKKSGSTVSSLRGMICAVSPDVSEAELRRIGKTIRDSCVGYDNVNIDIFNDEAAARNYSENNVRSTEHLVMNITRHKASGQDVMVRIRADGTREVVVE